MRKARNGTDTLIMSHVATSPDSVKDGSFGLQIPWAESAANVIRITGLNKQVEV
jgi:hypothetical protein